MNTKSLNEETEKVYSDYSEYLDSAGVRYLNNQNGFHVYIVLKNIKQSFTQICYVHKGEILLTDYCGNCYTGVRRAKQVAKAIGEKFPGYEIRVEQYCASFEIDVYHRIKYTSVEALHEAVLGVAGVVDEGARIGRETLGEDFER